jgi:hypothetical protein
MAGGSTQTAAVAHAPPSRLSSPLGGQRLNPNEQQFQPVWLNALRIDRRNRACPGFFMPGHRTGS